MTTFARRFRFGVGLTLAIASLLLLFGLPGSAASAADTPTATPTPFVTPEAGPGGYGLKVWTEQDALAALQDLKDFAAQEDIRDQSYSYHRFYFRAAQPLIRLAAQEVLLKFPETSHREDLEWQIALAEAIESNPKTSPDRWILTTIEDGLNTGHLHLATLDKFLEIHGFAIEQKQTVLNLLGDGRIATVLRLSTQTWQRDGLFFIVSYDRSGDYRAINLYSHWTFGFGDYDEFQVGDHTQDGIPEVVVLPADHNGTFCGLGVYIYQWEKGRFIDLTQGPDSPSGIQLNSCQSYWRWGEIDKAGFNTIETFEPSAYQVYPTIKETFGWNGRFYELGSTVMTPPEKLSDNYDWLVSAIQQGDYKAAEDKIVNTFYHTADNADMSDYVQLQLGLIYAWENKLPKATAALQDLSSNSLQSPKDGFKYIADKFLANYHEAGDIYKACEAILAIKLKNRPSFPLCNTEASFKALIENLNNTHSLISRAKLENSGVRVHTWQTIDLNQDGLLDYVILVDTPYPTAKYDFYEATKYDLWLIIDSGHGLRPFVVSDFRDLTGNYYHPDYPNVNVALTKLPSQESQAVFLKAGNFLYIFCIEEVNGDYRLNFLTERRFPFHGIASYSIEQVGNSLEVQMSAKPNALFVPWQNGGYSQATYRWNALWGVFSLSGVQGPRQTSVNDNPSDEAGEGERLLLSDHNYEDSIQKILHVLAQPKAKYEYFSRPRLGYLLGLAYELAGNTRDAVNVYWQLWHDYPDSPYALIVQRKLVRVQP